MVYAFKCRFGKKKLRKAKNIAYFIVNRSSSMTIDCKTLQKVWLGKPTDYSDMRIFGCTAYFHVRESKFVPEPRRLFS